MQYNFKDIELKWQKYWEENNTFKVENEHGKDTFYVLDMFPYPSGSGLHVGHPLGYIASDIYARYKRHCGFNVLHPQGYDSFGLPAEQYAIQTGQHPAVTTEENIKTYRRQLDRIGFSFDWSREIKTSSPEYYKWTQWIFIQLFNSWYNNDLGKAEDIALLVKHFEKQGNSSLDAVCDDDTPQFSAAQWSSFSEKQQQQILLKYRLTYLAETDVNWCPKLGTVLANDEIVNGVSERGGYPVIQKKMKQWSMRISAYAERLLAGLDTIDWTDAIKESQRNWIGKSKGALVSFHIENTDATIDVFTTRPDTIFGVSFMVLAPEHELVKTITTDTQKKDVETYIEATLKRTERDRMSDVKTISGVFTGGYAIHPFTKALIPIWIADYVLNNYGTGAVMAVPCGDQRDYNFAKHFDIEIPNIFKDIDISEHAYSEKDAILINSDFLNEMPYNEAFKQCVTKLEQTNQGKQTINYRLRDAVFSRQRYWGEPFPVYYKNGIPTMIEEKHLPVTLPDVAHYLPTESGNPPLGNATSWTWCTTKHEVVDNTETGHCMFPLELNTMPGWAGSSWYFFRYMDSKNDNAFASKEALAYWKQVDLYVGGSEHATGHLLYARFWTKFLHDRGYVSVDEPFKKLINQGMILGTSAIMYRLSGTETYLSKGLVNDRPVEKIRVDVNLVNASEEIDIEALKAKYIQFKNAEFELENGVYVVGREVEKMSKRWLNVVNPDDIVDQYGADSLRLYEMFLGPLEQYKPWNTAGITGVHNFLKKLWKLYVNKDGLNVKDTTASKESLKTLHKTIKKVREDIDNFSFNTSVSSFMIAVNELGSQKCDSRDILESLLILISPYAPHITEELWQLLGHETSISKAPFPEYDDRFLVEDTKKYPISFNGKVRFTMTLPLDMSKDAIEKTVLDNEKTQQHLEGNTIKKMIVVPGKIINIVI